MDRPLKRKGEDTVPASASSSSSSSSFSSGPVDNSYDSGDSADSSDGCYILELNVPNQRYADAEQYKLLKAKFVGNRAVLKFFESSIENFKRFRFNKQDATDYKQRDYIFESRDLKITLTCWCSKIKAC